MEFDEIIDFIDYVNVFGVFYVQKAIKPHWFDEMKKKGL